jgi:putative copper export protein
MGIEAALVASRFVHFATCMLLFGGSAFGLVAQRIASAEKREQRVYFRPARLCCGCTADRHPLVLLRRRQHDG